MDERVARLTTPKECEIFARNARARNRDDLAEQAKHHAIGLSAIAYGVLNEATHSEAERECLEAIYAYEQILSANNGKATKASKTWQLVKRHGIIAATERVIERTDVTAGYDALKEAGLEKYAFEATVLRHKELFSETAVTRSELRMAEYLSAEEASESKS